MRAWILILIWIGLGAVLGGVMRPIVGPSAWLVPLGWCAGSVLGGLGGAVFTIGSHRREQRLRRTFSAAIGASILGVFFATWAPTVASQPLEIWKLLLVAGGTVVVPPLTVALCLMVNDFLKR